MPENNKTEHGNLGFPSFGDGFIGLETEATKLDNNLSDIRGTSIRPVCITLFKSTDIEAKKRL